MKPIFLISQNQVLAFNRADNVSGVELAFRYTDSSLGETEDETKRVNSDIWRLGKTYFNRNPIAIVCEHVLSSCQ